MSVSLPANSLVFYSFLIKPAQFQFTSDDTNKKSSSLGSFNYYFERMNYKYLDLVSNLGTMLYMLAFTLFLVAVALLLYIVISSNER